MASLLRAGVVMSKAVATLRANGTLKEPLASQIEESVAAGSSLSSALQQQRDAFTAADVALIEAGETSGNLDQSLDRAARLEEERADARRLFITATSYPFLLVHVAAFLLPVANRGASRTLTFGGWLGDALTILLPLYCGIALVRWLNRSAVWRERFRRWIDRVPGFGAAARHRRRATFATVLEATYSAGIPVDRCVRLAGEAASMPGPAMEHAAGALAAGEPLTQTLANTNALPSRALAQLDTGERAGELSRVLEAIAAEEGSLASALLERSMMTLGKGVYLFVALWIAWAVISFYLSLYSGVL